MGVKKKNEEWVKLVSKIFIVGACLLFVGLMILSGMGTSWLTMFSVVKPGDSVVIDYTLYDAAGKPILTTDQQLYTQTASTSGGMVFSKQIALTSNQSLAGTLYPVQMYTPNGGWSKQFAIFAPEYNAITAGIVGMKPNEKKRISIPSGTSMTQQWSADQLLRNNVNISDIQVGDILAMGVSDRPEEMATNASALTYIRIGEITQKTPSGVVVDFGYPSVDVKVVSINKQ